MVDNIEKFKGDIEDFLSELKYKDVAYFLKYRGQNSIKIWWESKDEWFLNVAWGKKKTEEYKESSWVLRSQAVHYLNYMFIKDGYDIYIKKNNDE